MNCIFLRRSYPEPKPKKLTMTLTGTFNSSYGYVTINGTKYKSAQTVEVEAGTEISVYVGGRSSTGNCQVSLNGTKVHSGAGTYTFVPTNNATIKMSMSGSSYYSYYFATITM